MNKSEAKKQLILDRGLQVMKSHGYNGTSVKDIVDAAGVPKGSFYNYFDSKESFALTAIESVGAENLQMMSRSLSNKNLSAKERVVHFFEAGIGDCCENEFRVGCFLGNMCQEMADNSEVIRRKIQQLMSSITEKIEATLLQAQEDGDLDSGYDAKSTAEFLINAWQGSLMRMKASSCSEPLDAFYKHVNLLFDTKTTANAS